MSQSNPWAVTVLDRELAGRLPSSSPLPLGVVSAASAVASSMTTAPPVEQWVRNTAVTERNAGQATATSTIIRATPRARLPSSTRPATAPPKVANNDDTALALTTVSLAAGETTKTVTVNVTGEITVETETLNLVLSAATTATVADTRRCHHPQLRLTTAR